MPLGRATSRRVPTNENDENSVAATTRLTRSKSMASTGDEGALASKKPLQSKKAAVNTQPLRKRAALGDVSNVTKGDAQEGKKALGKVAVAAKQPTGVTKLSRTNSSRPALGSKDGNKKAAELKRPGSGLLPSTKRKSSSTTSSTTVKAETPVEDEQPSRKKIHIEVKKEVKVEVAKEESVDPETELAIEDEKSTATKFAEGVEDLDKEDMDDPLMVAEYVVEIFDYLKELELSTLPNADYMEHQEDLEWKMRGILVDWLIEVHTRFHLLPETLFLAVNIIDRFLSAKAVQLDRLQLVGVTAMFIASKYEEVLSPHVANFKHVADDGFSEQEILSAESYPNPMNFLRRISKADNYDIQTRTLGKYLMEISLLDHRFMHYLPSHVAAASMYLARMILERGEWDATLTHYSGYNEEEIEPVFRLMVDYLARPVSHEAFFKKYASKKFLKASILTRSWAKRHAAELDIDASEPLEVAAR
ncbi:putative G2/mitotic-specific cyclin-B [Glarea lozoyensis 74030]|uniref:Putative G2/mitotic-specific cyclin-B n=1 Tax=Glarea lozoyensis (strain ATCC 74030 / MF5533) TaxID=1104152 RepID=H0EG86_GLAL7|nr:putative G2/mitotic-specific cyclin-B [Glarea lozoyensis 74030]